MTSTIKISLAIFLLLCLLDMPYGYYQWVRWSAMVGFGLLAFQTQGHLRLLYLALALLFQPFLKIALGRGIWMGVDILVATGLILSLLLVKNKEPE